MKKEMLSIMKKDWHSLASNKRMLLTLCIVPIILTMILPSIFVIGIYFLPDKTADLQNLMALLPPTQQTGDMQQIMIGLMLNYIMPIFFLIIPIMSASVMAASSFVGEKEKRTLETLLYCPLSLKQIFRSKVLASFFVSMSVSMLSFFIMVVVLEMELLWLSGYFILPDVKWLLVMIVVSPAISLIAITLIVRFSAKAKSIEDAQQGTVLLILPLVLLLAGQFTGIMLINTWILLALGILCALIASYVMKKAMGSFSYESLLKP